MKCDKPGNENTERRIEIVYRPITELELDPKNPRFHSPRQVRQIGHSIKIFGMNVPILVNRAGRVIAGHGRIMACQQLGWTEVPTISLEHLTEAQARTFMIADNRLTENSEWDERLLAEQLKELSELDLDFALDVTGFEIGEIDLRIEQLSSASDGDGHGVPALSVRDASSDAAPNIYPHNFSGRCVTIYEFLTQMLANPAELEAPKAKANGKRDDQS